MACLEWQDEMAKIKEQNLQKVEGKGFFFIFYLKIVWISYQADSDGSGHDMVWLDLSARY